MVFFFDSACGKDTKLPRENLGVEGGKVLWDTGDVHRLWEVCLVQVTNYPLICSQEHPLSAHHCTIFISQQPHPNSLNPWTPFQKPHIQHPTSTNHTSTTTTNSTSTFNPQILVKSDPYNIPPPTDTMLSLGLIHIQHPYHAVHQHSSLVQYFFDSSASKMYMLQPYEGHNLIQVKGIRDASLGPSFLPIYGHHFLYHMW